MRQENLGDLYAKSGAQSIASSLVGMGFGIGLGAMMANKSVVQNLSANVEFGVVGLI